MREEKIVGVCLGLGDIFAGGDGPLIHPTDGSVARMMRACKYANASGCSFVLFASAGFSKESPDRPCNARQVSLAMQLKNYCTMFHGSIVYKICIPDHVWGTEPEIVSAIAGARRGFVSKDDKVTLAIATNWAHLPRVFLYSMRHKPIEWKLKLVVAKHHFSLFSTIREVPAFLIELVKSMFT